MERDALFQRQELFAAAATVAAHATSPEGFRQRDVRFLIELFVNWVESAVQRSNFLVQNTQVQRYLQFLANEGYARKLTRGTHPAYRLTRTGLLELLSRMVETPQLASGSQFFFLFYYLRNYGPRIEELVKGEGKQFPFALRLELERLLDAKALVERELSFAHQEQKKLSRRIDDARATNALTCAWRKQGRPFEQIVLEAEKRYPYELNSQKPLRELIFGIPEAFREWELSVGNQRRVDDMWVPEQRLLECYIAQLEQARKRLEGE